MNIYRCKLASIRRHNFLKSSDKQHSFFASKNQNKIYKIRFLKFEILSLGGYIPFLQTKKCKLQTIPQHHKPKKTLKLQSLKKKKQITPKISRILNASHFFIFIRFLRGAFAFAIFGGFCDELIISNLRGGKLGAPSNIQQ